VDAQSAPGRQLARFEAFPVSKTTPKIAHHELSVLADFSQAFATTVDIQQTIQVAIERITEYLNAEAGAIFLVDPSSGEAVCRAASGETAKAVLGFKVAPGQGIVGRVIESAQPRLVEDVQHDPDFIGNKVTGFMPRTMVCVPLSTSGGVIGAVQIINKTNNRFFNQPDADLLRLLSVPTALALNNAKLAQDLVEQNRIRREFQLARQIQKSLLPARKRNFPLQAFNLPAREISGDFYDYFELQDGRIGFCAGDVSGKGMDAALLMVRAGSLLRWCGKDGIPSHRWLEKVNEELATTVVRGMFVCAIVGYYDPASRMVEVSSAGFPPALVQAADGRLREIHAHGPPLGILSDASFERERFLLGGSTLWCFSDGVTDLRGQQNALLGVAGVGALLERVRELSPRARLRGLLTQLRGMRLADDTTVLMLAEPDPNTPSHLGSVGINTDPENLRLLRRLTESQCRMLGFDQGETQQLVLAIDEAAANVIRHAYHLDPSGRLELHLHLEGDMLVMRMIDYAPVVDTSKIKPRDLSECRPGGLGINLIDQVMDSWRFEEPKGPVGNLLTMRKRVPFRSMQDQHAAPANPASI
jgi:sigma-B regulation protein RsbU (phosphoserine phosphatase)